MDNQDDQPKPTEIIKYANIYNTNRTFYLLLMMVSVTGILLGVNFFFFTPTFNPFEIPKDIVGLGFLILGLAQIVFLNLYRNLTWVRRTQFVSFCFTLFWGVATSHPSFQGESSFQLPIVSEASGQWDQWDQWWVVLIDWSHPAIIALITMIPILAGGYWGYRKSHGVDEDSAYRLEMDSIVEGQNVIIKNLQAEYQRQEKENGEQRETIAGLRLTITGMERKMTTMEDRWQARWEAMEAKLEGCVLENAELRARLDAR